MKKIILTLAAVLWLAGAGVAPADDTSIYGATTIDVPPNVLIIFDTSGSMGDYINASPYDPGTAYAGSYDNNAVYEWTTIYEDQQRTVCTGYGRHRVCKTETVSVPVGHQWVEFATSIAALNCDGLETALSSTGYIIDNAGAAPGYGCSGNERNLETGNFLNYDYGDYADMRPKIDIAKEAMTNVINNTTNVRFGLMRFNEDHYGTNDGGRLVTNGQIGASKDNLITAIDSLTANGHTPLAETLAEAGLYFAGKDSWYDGPKTYTSPIQYECQKNFIIFMTDGEPTSDDDSRLDNAAYVNKDGDVIGDYDGDGSNRMNRLPDVAKYLYDNDIRPDLGDAGSRFEKQNIKTYTIGFTSDQALLQKTADDDHGHGKYFTTRSISGLEAALNSIMHDINEVNASYVSPVVPISRTNQVYAGDRIYIGLFKPQAEGGWLGNVKKFEIGLDGTLLDKTGHPATDENGMIVETAVSFWSTSADGASVDKGGLGAVLNNQSVRNIYTKAGASNDLTDSSNAFSKTNALITPALLGVATDTQKDTVIDTIYGVGKDWKLGDILHSQPTVIHYGSDKSMIFVGSNDGMLHCFDDDDASGKELWAFIPAEQLSRLQNLSVSDDGVHDYFIDGVPVVYDNGSQKILIVGERRGGDHYYALDVTDYTHPQFLYSIGPTQLGAGDQQRLGQSWGKAKTATIATSSGTANVFLLPGGYDNINEDKPIPDAADSLGRSVFSVKTSDGTTSAFKFDASTFSGMDHSIVDLIGIDPDNNGITNRIYAPDLGGQMFAFEDDNGDGTWNGRDLFNASADAVQRKIFYAPDVIKINQATDGGQEMLFFGTGDRANPNGTDVVDRFYAVKNSWATDFTTMTESDLVDVTADTIQMGSDSQKSDAQQTLESNSNKGWYIRLGLDTGMTGEKVVSAPIVFNGVVYFTTYVPKAAESESDSDPCHATGASGVSYLYAVDYQTGAAVYKDWHPDKETDGSGNQIDLSNGDRRIPIGHGISDTPIISIRENGALMNNQVEGGLRSMNVTEKVLVHTYYWRDR
jgi:type IV pilus assembly protein PilY1